jgi:putative spermidine/putrescine transport system substrate-binding protein
LTRIRYAVGALLAAALSVPTAFAGEPDRAAKSGKGEGKLTMIAWEGYLDAKWVQPFETLTGCKVTPKYAGSSDEMVSLMRSGGGGQYDMVSASGDASLRLIYGGDVAEIDVKRVPAWKQFFKSFQSPPNNTVAGKHYGISLQWGPNTLLYRTDKVKPTPRSWSALYDPKFKGKITVPNNPIQIADAALYLSKAKPSLGIRDPYELNDRQFGAAIDLLKKQKPLVKKYWGLAADEISLFKNGDALIGASWPYTTNSLIAAKVPVKEIIPREGATGWLDTWMLSKKAKHPECGYLWLQYISTAPVQALQAVTYRQTPVNRLACGAMNKLSKGSCTQYHANAPEAYYRSIKFWKTPLAACGNGKRDCKDYSEWVKAWNEVIS